MPLSVSSALSLLTGTQNGQFGSSLDGDAGDFLSLLDNNSNLDQDLVDGGLNPNSDLLASDHNASSVNDGLSAPVQVPSAIFASNQPAPSQPVTPVDTQPQIQQAQPTPQAQPSPNSGQQPGNKLTPIMQHPIIKVSSKSTGHQDHQNSKQANAAQQPAGQQGQVSAQAGAQTTTTQSASSGSGSASGAGSASGSSSGSGAAIDTMLQASTFPGMVPLSKLTRNQLKQLDDLLSQMLQGVAAMQAPQTPIVNTPVGASSTDGTSVDATALQAQTASSGSGSGAAAADPLDQILAALGLSLSGEAGASSSSGASASGSAGTSDLSLPSSPVTLLSDIQSILQQLQTLMQQGGSTKTVASATASGVTDITATTAGSASGGGSAAGDANDIAAPVADSTDTAQQTLLGALTKDISALRNLLNPATQRASTATKIITTATTTVSTSSGSGTSSGQTGSLQNLVNNTLSLVKNLLAKPATANAQATLQANAQNMPAALPQSGIADLATQLKDWMQSHKSSMDDASDKLSSVSADAAAALPSPAAKPLADGPLLFLPVINSSVSSDSSSDNSNNNDSGNNNAQPSVVPASATSAAQAPAPTAATASFAKVLDQMSSSSSSLTDQVTFQIKTAVADGSSKISIQLSPEDLGKLDIRLDVGADGKTGNIVITADNKTTLELLQKDAGGLQRALSDAGLNMGSGSMSFNLRQGQQESGQNGNAQAAINYQKAAPEEEETTLPAGVISSSYVVNVTEGLDIRI